MAEDNDFLEQQRRAIERMNEMYSKQQIKTGGYPMPPAPSFVRINNDANKTTNSNNTEINLSKENNGQN